MRPSDPPALLQLMGLLYDSLESIPTLWGEMQDLQWSQYERTDTQIAKLKTCAAYLMGLAIAAEDRIAEQAQATTDRCDTAAN